MIDWILTTVHHISEKQYCNFKKYKRY